MIPDDIMETAFALTAGDWNQPHDVRAKKVAAAILAERKRCADIAKRFMEEQEGYNFGIHLEIMGEE